MLALVTLVTYVALAGIDTLITAMQFALSQVTKRSARHGTTRRPARHSTMFPAWGRELPLSRLEP
jgi:hypothetical protein